AERSTCAAAAVATGAVDADELHGHVRHPGHELPEFLRDGRTDCYAQPGGQRAVQPELHDAAARLQADVHAIAVAFLLASRRRKRKPDLSLQRNATASRLACSAST